MKKIVYILAAVMLIGCNTATENNNAENQPAKDQEPLIPQASSYFPKERAQVLVVGVFHFNYPGLDEHKTSEEDKVDVLKEPKKSELSELVEYIKKFKPNKIAVEANPGWGATEKLREYKEGMHRDKRGERYQIAMRIAAETNIDTLYEVNSYSMIRELSKKDSITYKMLTEGVNWEYDDPLWDNFKDWLDTEDKLANEVHLKDYIINMNSPEAHQYGYGVYLIGMFKSDDHKGADYLSMWWYNRNLRIFKNIQDITEGPDDRIMIVMGNGHAAILRQLFESSPEYDFIELSEL